MRIRMALSSNCTVPRKSLAGVNRVGTRLSPAHNSLTYLQNLCQHTHRPREVAQVLKDHGHRFGLEYVSTQTSQVAPMKVGGLAITVA